MKDIRYLNYKDSLEAYTIGYSVAQNMADTLNSMYGYKQLENYFLNRYSPDTYTTDGGYFYEYIENPTVDIGHLNVPYKRMKNDSTFPWAFLENQYKRLNAIKIHKKKKNSIKGSRKLAGWDNNTLKRFLMF